MTDTITLVDNITQGQLMVFKREFYKETATLESEWGSDWTQLPVDVVYHTMLVVGIKSGWVETDLTPDDINALPVPNDVGKWGEEVFNWYFDVVSPDPE